MKEDYPKGTSPEANFEALWQLIDEHYCFFDYKRETLGVDWDAVHTEYSKKLSPKMNRYQLFEVLSQMLGELRDGHVNLGAAFDLGRNWSYFEDFPSNYDESLVEDYLGTGSDYSIAASLRYRILEDNVGYVRVSSFANGFGDGNLDYMFDNLRMCRGLIIDLRDNGGGNLDDAHRLAARFTNEKRLVGYICHKTGKGHNDFSTAEPMYIEPSKGVRWQKPVVVITNRAVYSAANDFVKCMREFPNVTILGDHTGGGSGMPFTLELPNGWSVRYSAVVFLDANKKHTEFGIDPDIFVILSDEDRQRHTDSLIEAARSLF